MMRAQKRVRVQRTPRIGSAWLTYPWQVTCDYCAGDGFLGIFPALKGGARRWRAAMDYAVAHAREHEARRCPTCHHVPTGELPKET